MFHEIVWQHVQGVMGFLITGLVQMYQEIFQWKNFKNRLRFDGVCGRLFGPPCKLAMNQTELSLSRSFTSANCQFDSVAAM